MFSVASEREGCLLPAVAHAGLISARRHLENEPSIFGRPARRVSALYLLLVFHLFLHEVIKDIYYLNSEYDIYLLDCYRCETVRLIRSPVNGVTSSLLGLIQS